jgi:hypothetical protein
MDNGQLRSQLDEHLVVLLVIATLLVGFVAAVPSVTARATGTAAHVQDRVNRPATVLAEFDAAP